MPVCAGSLDCTLKVWVVGGGVVDGGACEATLAGHLDGVNCCAALGPFTAAGGCLPASPPSQAAAALAPQAATQLTTHTMLFVSS